VRGTFFQQALVRWGKRKPKILRVRRAKKPTLSLRHGLSLIFGIGAFVALIFALVYFIWYLPMQKALQ
jgi:hypothetical protein